MITPHSHEGDGAAFNNAPTEDSIRMLAVQIEVLAYLSDEEHDRFYAQQCDSGLGHVIFRSHEEQEDPHVTFMVREGMAARGAVDLFSIKFEEGQKGRVILTSRNKAMFTKARTVMGELERDEGLSLSERLIIMCATQVLGAVEEEHAGPDEIMDSMHGTLRGLFSSAQAPFIATHKYTVETEKGGVVSAAVRKVVDPMVRSTYTSDFNLIDARVTDPETGITSRYFCDDEKKLYIQQVPGHEVVDFIDENRTLLVEGQVQELNATLFDIAEKKFAELDLEKLDWYITCIQKLIESVDPASTYMEWLVDKLVVLDGVFNRKFQDEYHVENTDEAVRSLTPLEQQLFYGKCSRNGMTILMTYAASVEDGETILHTIHEENIRPVFYLDTTVFPLPSPRPDETEVAMNADANINRVSVPAYGAHVLALYRDTNTNTLREAYFSYLPGKIQPHMMDN